jgi:hypothetical protein
MSSADKSKLNGIASGAEVNQNAFGNVKVGSTTIQADGKTDTLELVAGTNISLTPDATNDRVTINVSGTVASATAATNATNHINASSGAHTASAISCTATGDVAATTVQAAIAELASEKVPTSDVVTTATASKLLKLNSTGALPANITGNAATATKLASARTIALTGDVTGSGSFNGSGNLSIPVTVGALATIPASITLNGSFEQGNSVPTGWNVQYFTSGTGGFETDNPAHGSRAWKFTHPGGSGCGGGWMESQMFEVSEIRTKMTSIGFTIWSSVAGIQNIVKAYFYDKSKTFLSEVILYDSINNPTTPTFNMCWFPSIPSGSRFCKVLLIGGNSATNVAGTTYFDDVVINPPEVFKPIMCKTSTITCTTGGLEASSGGYNYTNIFTGDFNIPNTLMYNYPYGATIILPVEIHTSRDTTLGHARLLVGSTYSNAQTATDKSGFSIRHLTITVPGPISFPLSFTLQAKIRYKDGTGDSGCGSVNVRIASPALITTPIAFY